MTRPVLIGVLASISWFGDEFTDEMSALWYQQAVAGVPVHYILFGVLIVAGFVFSSPGPAYPLTAALKRLGLWRWVVLVWITLMTAIGLALARGVSELFADWRNWAVVASTTVVVVKLTAGKPWARHLLADVAMVWGLLSIPLLVTWALGGGTDLFDVRIPLFNGYNLVLAGLAGFVGLDLWMSKYPGLSRRVQLLSMVSAISGTMFVALSFRRAFWGFLIAGFVVVMMDSYLRRRVTFDKGVVLVIGAMLVVSAAVATFGLESLTARLESFIPSNDNQYSATNDDHVGDLADAFSVITTEPLFGLGIGQYYETARIAEWKAQSFEVHNAVLQVWLKFGLLGILTYVGFTIALIQAVWRHRDDVPGFVGLAAFLVGLQVVSLVQTWPFQSFKLSVAHGLILAMLVVNTEPARREVRSSAADRQLSV